MTRRNFMQTLLLVSSTFISTAYAKTNTILAKSNFKTIYGNTLLKNNFLSFITNIVNLYPADKLHNLITQVSNEKENDEEIYTTVQNQLNSISPCFSSFRYELPTLRTQNNAMTKQTLKLLDVNREYNGYLEVGSLGQYLDYLEEELTLTGKFYYLAEEQSNYGLEAMVKRGQIALGAESIALNDYKTDFSSIKEESLDLITVYIGFHHIPLKLRSSFIQNLSKRLRPGGKLILRDHDCYDETQKAMLNVVHNVVNMMTKETPKFNTNETRNFYNLKFIQDYVKNIGFELDEKVLYQEGDPSKNALMMFTKV